MAGAGPHCDLHHVTPRNSRRRPRLDLALTPDALYPDVAVATIGAVKWSRALAVPRDSVAEHLLRDAASHIY